MSTAKKIAIAGFGVLVVVLITVLIFITCLSRKGLPDYEKDIVIKGLYSDVTVYRDRYAVPHIYAENEHDLYLATGYVMAQDRLWQMDLLRRVTVGRLSEIFGKNLVETDLLFRALKITEKSTMVLEKTEPEIKKSLEAFTAGVNQYISDAGSNLPVEFSILGYRPEKWEVIHSVNLVGYMAWDLAGGWETKIVMHLLKKKLGDKMAREITPDISEYTEVYPEFAQSDILEEVIRNVVTAGRVIDNLGLQVFNGSNNWAVSGKKSVTGKPILANDMHLGLNVPGIWYQVHQNIPGKLNVTGVALPGAPQVVCGHNDSIAWGMTNVGVDNLDFFVEKVNPDRSDEYLYRGKWEKMKVRKEIISIKKGGQVEKELRFTVHGPIVSEIKKIDDMMISMKWQGNEESNELRAIHLLNRAKDWNDFKNAVKSFISVSQNINYADVNGNIGLYCSAGIPIRKKGNGMELVPGWNGEYDWSGIVPFEKLPSSYNPEKGYVSSANNKTVSRNYPYFISIWGFATSYRIDRINEALESKKTFSVDDFKVMHSDFKSKLPEKFTKDIVKIVKEDQTINETGKKALALLDSWNSEMKPDSPAAAVFEVFYLKFMDNTFRDDMGETLYDEYRKSRSSVQHAIDKLWNTESEWFDLRTTADRRESFSDIVRLSFRQAVDELKKEFGNNPDSWEWGDIHTLTLKHPLGSVKILDLVFGLNKGPFPMGGSFHTVPQLAYKYTKAFGIVHGPSQRHVYDLSDWDKSFTVIPTGNSGIPGSSHYCDQTELYVEGKYHPDYFSRGAVEKNAKYVMKYRSR